MTFWGSDRKEPQLDKIVILADSPERGRALASCLRILFPEWGVEIQSGIGLPDEDARKALPWHPAGQGVPESRPKPVTVKNGKRSPDVRCLYFEEPSTQPTKVALECELESEIL